MNEKHNSKLTKHSQRLRKEMTPEEKQLWYQFLKQLPFTFHRQKVIGHYIVDFYCAKAMLVIELDGTQHYETDGQKADVERDAFLCTQGLHVLRYSNRQINQEFSRVCEDILQHLNTSSTACGGPPFRSPRNGPPLSPAVTFPPLVGGISSRGRLITEYHLNNLLLEEKVSRRQP